MEYHSVLVAARCLLVSSTSIVRRSKDGAEIRESWHLGRKCVWFKCQVSDKECWWRTNHLYLLKRLVPCNRNLAFSARTGKGLWGQGLSCGTLHLKDSDSFERREPQLRMILSGFPAQKQFPRKEFPELAYRSHHSSCLGGQVPFQVGGRTWQSPPHDSSFTGTTDARLRRSWGLYNSSREPLKPAMCARVAILLGGCPEVSVWSWLWNCGCSGDPSMLMNLGPWNFCWRKLLAWRRVGSKEGLCVPLAAQLRNGPSNSWSPNDSTMIPRRCSGAIGFGVFLNVSLPVAHSFIPVPQNSLLEWEYLFCAFLCGKNVT